MRSLVAFLALAGTAGLAAAQDAPARRLDYAREVRQSSMVFVPYQGLGQRGPVYFTQYLEEVSKTSKAGDLRRLFVNLVPVAYRDGSYSSFVAQQGILDDKVLPIPAATACRPTAALSSLLAGMPTGYRPNVLGGNWPFLCTVSVWFLPEDEQTVRDAIAASHAAQLSASVSLCAPDSPQVSSPAIVAQLVSRGALQSVSASKATGSLWDVLYDSVTLSLERPELFATSDPREGWEAWMAELQVDTSSATVTLEGLPVQYPVYVCRPAPLQLAY